MPTKVYISIEPLPYDLSPLRRHCQDCNGLPIGLIHADAPSVMTTYCIQCNKALVEEMLKAPLTLYLPARCSYCFNYIKKASLASSTGNIICHKCKRRAESGERPPSNQQYHNIPVCKNTYATYKQPPPKVQATTLFEPSNQNDGGTLFDSPGVEVDTSLNDLDEALDKQVDKSKSKQLPGWGAGYTPEQGDSRPTKRKRKRSTPKDTPSPDPNAPKQGSLL